MDKSLIDIIKNQTNIEDEIEIQRVFYECKDNLADTIIKLSEIKIDVPVEKRKTIFDDMRLILDEKAYIYQNLMNNK